MKPKTHAKAGRPSLGGRQRPILPRTSVAPSTLAIIQGEPRANGRIIDDAVTCYVAVRDAAAARGCDMLLVLTGL